jgi:hypothetical protein
VNYEKYTMWILTDYFMPTFAWVIMVALTVGIICGIVGAIRCLFK